MQELHRYNTSNSSHVKHFLWHSADIYDLIYSLARMRRCQNWGKASHEPIQWHPLKGGTSRRVDRKAFIKLKNSSFGLC